MRLYEPNGQPFRDAEEIDVGRGGGGTARIVVRAEDLVPGVYELDVTAPPLGAATVTVRAELGPVDVAPAPGGLELSDPGTASATVQVTQALIGAERGFEVTGRGAPPESISVRVPEWAARAVIDVQMPRDQWDEFTDFGVTDFDSAGQQIGQGAMNYAFARHSFDVPPALRKAPVTIELFPAFARDGGAQPWRATVRVRFLFRDPQPFGGARDVTVVAGGRAAVPLARPPSLALPEGFTPLIEVRAQAAGEAGGAEAVRRIALPAARP